MGLVGVLLVVDFFTALLLGAQVYTLSRENGDLRVNLAKSEEELSRVTPELKRLRADLDELVRGKLPRLRKLEYDRVMALETGYLKNITFTEIVNIGNHEFEYKLVIQNNTGGTLWPEIQILLFNEIGIQVGIAEIGTLSSLALKVDSLGIDEVRSYSGSISLIDKKIKPAYFMVRIPEQARNKPETLELESRERK